MFCFVSFMYVYIGDMQPPWQGMERANYVRLGNTLPVKVRPCVASHCKK
jgi:hypothetical protein